VTPRSDLTVIHRRSLFQGPWKFQVPAASNESNLNQLVEVGLPSDNQLPDYLFWLFSGSFTPIL